MKKIFILSIIFCLFVSSLLTSCKDDGVKPEPVPETYSLLGKWYHWYRDDGPNDTCYMEVTFTDTTVTARDYGYNVENIWFPGRLLNANDTFYKDIKYIRHNDTLEIDLIDGTRIIDSISSDGFIYDHYIIHNLKTSIRFYSKDTLFIERFIKGDADVLPPMYSRITLYRRY